MPLAGWVQRIATISRRIVVATFFNYNVDAIPLPIACVSRGAVACMLCPARMLYILYPPCEVR